MPDQSTTRSAQVSADEASWGAMVNNAIDIQKLVAMFRRHIWLMLGVSLAIFLVMVAVTLRETPLYSSTASLLIDVRQQNVVESEQVLSGLSADTSVIDSEVEVLRSRELAESVVRDLNLIQDPELNPTLQEPSGASAVIRSIKSLLAPRPSTDVQPASHQDAELAGTVSAVMDRLTIRRVGLTFVMNITVVSESPQKAARIANAFAQRYLADQLAAKTDATSGANAFIRQQLSETRGQVRAAELAVSQYRSRNGLLSAEGAPLTEQEISAYNQQLAAARAQQAEEEARLRTARAQLAQGSNGDDVGEALNSEVIQALRARRSEVSGRVADLTTRYGPRHPELVRAEGELSDFDAQIATEIRRIVSNLQARVDVARGRTVSVQNSLSAARGVLANNSAASVQLADLERNAEALRQQQASLLRREQETAAQQGIQRPDARVVSNATVPSRPTSPKVMLNVLLGLVLGGAVGLVAVILAEMMDNGLATSEAVEQKLGVRHLGSVPIMNSVAETRDRHLSPIDYVSQRPLSAFAEALRSLRTSIVHANEEATVKRVALTSALPDEGKTTTAICLARLSSQAGARVLLIDCDLRRRAATRMLNLHPETGLTEVIAGSAPLDGALILDEASGAFILPATADGASQDVLGTPAMDALLDQLGERFDLVFMDTPPVLAVSDARAIASKADAVVLLVRWRKTPIRAVTAALRLLHQSNVPFAGVALTRVDMKAQTRHGYGDAAYFYNDYKKYYQ